MKFCLVLGLYHFVVSLIHDVRFGRMNMENIFIYLQ